MGSKTTRAWPITLTREEFNRFFYKYTTNACADGVPELHISNRLIEKLQDPEIAERHEPTQEVKDAADAANEFWVPWYRLYADSHTFLLEQDEKRLALARLDKNIGRLPPALGMEYEVMRQKLVQAKPIDVTPAGEDAGVEQEAETDLEPADA